MFCVKLSWERSSLGIAQAADDSEAVDYRNGDLDISRSVDGYLVLAVVGARGRVLPRYGAAVPIRSILDQYRFQLEARRASATAIAGFGEFSRASSI